MAKWLVGCLALVVVAAAAFLWFGYRKFREFTGAGPSTTITIGAPPSRVFASLANADSMSVWRQVASISSTRKAGGMLQVGDTLRAQMRLPTDTADRFSTEVVTALVPDRLLVLETLGEGAAAGLMIRRDSLAALGDSTQVITTFELPASDSARARLDSSNAGERRMMDMATNLVLSVARMQAGFEHKKLKGRIEGTPKP